nr:hypothetical protein [Tanacetum cinerariifolium]
MSMKGKEIAQPKISDPKLSENETSIVGFEPQNATPEALSTGFEYSSAYGANSHLRGVSELSGFSHASTHLLRVDGSSHIRSSTTHTLNFFVENARPRCREASKGTTSQVQGITSDRVKRKLKPDTESDVFSRYSNLCARNVRPRCSSEAAHANSAESMQSMHNGPTDSVSPIPEDSIRADTLGSNRCKKTRLNTDTRLPAGFN